MEVNGAVLTLLRRLGVELGLPFNPAGSEVRPCRAGQLYRVDLGGRPFALKLYDEGYHNELTFHQAVAGTGMTTTRPRATSTLESCRSSGLRSCCSRSD